ncbi:hypothetical protein CgunFtcFv8_021060 [Champsocephalus gunnari]|uniref:Uncharacterized protein n=1 Tax=Champsocephalus gunnari TaxID=52237 RepID=A0AAN8EDW8_CHAGU|nr:hypothetical protein CgunFtcFv8_021060 [Champsocephalus gunnari]
MEHGRRPELSRREGVQECATQASMNVSDVWISPEGRKRPDRVPERATHGPMEHGRRPEPSRRDGVQECTTQASMIT